MESSLDIINSNGLVNSEGLPAGSAVHWLCGRDTPGTQALSFAHVLPKKKPLPRTKEQSYRERRLPKWLELKGTEGTPQANSSFYLGGTKAQRAAAQSQ